MSETIDAIVNAINELRERVEALEGNSRRIRVTDKWKHVEEKPYLPTLKAWDEKTGGKLTVRQLEILYFKAQGFTNAQTATELCIAAGTVKWHITDIYRSLRLHTSTELMAYIFGNLVNEQQPQEQP